MKEPAGRKMMATPSHNSLADYLKPRRALSPEREAAAAAKRTISAIEELREKETLKRTESA